MHKKYPNWQCYQTKLSTARRIDCTMTFSTKNLQIPLPSLLNPSTFDMTKIRLKSVRAKIRRGPRELPKWPPRRRVLRTMEWKHEWKESHHATRQWNSRQREPMSIFKHVSGQEEPYFWKMNNFGIFKKNEIRNRQNEVFQHSEMEYQHNTFPRDRTFPI